MNHRERPEFNQQVYENLLEQQEVERRKEESRQKFEDYMQKQYIAYVYNLPSTLTEKDIRRHMRPVFCPHKNKPCKCMDAIKGEE